MRHHALWFEARSLQEYILASGRVRDIVGASELVDQLTCAGGLLDQVCQQLGVDPSSNFSRRAGGAFVLLMDQTQLPLLKRFADLWSMLVASFAPQLEYVITIGNGETPLQAAENAANQARELRNRGPLHLPEAGPYCHRAPRTGMPAVTVNDKEWIDAASVAKRAYRNTDSLAAKFPLSAGIWPTNMEPWNGRRKDSGAGFPYLTDNHQIAIVHIDGNGFGVLLRKVNEQVRANPESYCEKYRQFSKLIQDVTNKATEKAIARVIQPQISANAPIAPMRPLLLGGDDLTVLIRPDLALPFVSEFAQAFEEISKAQLPNWAGVEKLTVGAGIVVQGASQPFFQGYELAEQICRHAKNIASRFCDDKQTKPSTVGFYRVTTAGFNDWQEILQNELTISAGDQTKEIQLTAGCYGVGSSKFPAPLMALQTLAKVLKSHAGTQARYLLTLMQQNSAQAKDQYDRWRQMLDKAKPEDSAKVANEKKALAKLMQALQAFGELRSDLPVVESNLATFCPLGDAIALNTFGQADIAEEQTS